MELNISMNSSEIRDDDQLLQDVIRLKIEITELKFKKRVLLEELFRQFFEGEKEPKKRKRREVKLEEIVTAAEVDSTEVASMSASSLVAKKRRRRVSGIAAFVPSNETEA